MPKPTQQQLDQWWGGLQRTLDEAGADIDLSNPSDLIRFRVTEITGKSKTSADAKVTAYFPFADNKTMKLEQVTDEELIASMKPGKPNQKKLMELYTAAKEGRLFFNSIYEKATAARQLVINKDGASEVLPDFSHPTEEMKLAMETLYPPQKPQKKSVGLGTRIAALFGNEDARKQQASCKEYNKRYYDSDMRKYEQKMAKWEQVNQLKMTNPDFVRQAQNQAYSISNYFQKPMDEEGAERETRLGMVGTIAHKQRKVDMIADQTRMNEERAAKELSDMMKAGSDVTPEARKLVAEICYQRMLGQHVVQEFKNETKNVYAIAPENVKMTEASLDEAVHQTVKNSPQYKERFAKTCGSALFQDILNQLPEEKIRGFAQDPKKAADNVYGFCTSSVRKAATALKDAPVKQAAKDFTATHNRPQLEQVQPKKPSNEAPMLR